MKVRTTPLAQRLHHAGDEALQGVFFKYPQGLTIHQVLARLPQLLADKEVVPHYWFEAGTPSSLAQTLRQALYVELMPLLPRLLWLAQQEVDSTAPVSSGESADEREREEARVVIKAFQASVTAYPDPLVNYYPGAAHVRHALAEKPAKGARADGIDADAVQWLIDQHGGEWLLALCRPPENGGVSRVPIGRHFTYAIGGDEAIFSGELRAQLERAIGTSLLETTHPSCSARKVLTLPAAVLMQLQALGILVPCGEPADVDALFDHSLLLRQHAGTDLGVEIDLPAQHMNCQRANA